jgi:hypothetical protein
MFEILGKGITTAKDKAFEVSAKAFLNRKIESFGQITNLQIDSAAHIASLTLVLKGEVSPISIHLDSYEIMKGEEATRVRVNNMRASREWIEAALKQYVVGQTFKVPKVLNSFL